MLSPFVAFHARRFLIVVTLTLVFAIGFALVGKYMDLLFKTGPLFLIIALILAFVLLQFVLLKVTRKLVKQHQDKVIK